MTAAGPYRGEGLGLRGAGAGPQPARTMGARGGGGWKMAASGGAAGRLGAAVPARFSCSACLLAAAALAAGE